MKYVKHGLRLARHGLSGGIRHGSNGMAIDRNWTEPAHND